MQKTRVNVGMYAFYCEEPRQLATFWSELMDLPLTAPDDDLAMLDLDHEVTPFTWMFHRVDDDAPPRANRIGLDLGIDDEENWTAVADRAEAAGATRLAQHEHEGVHWIEMLDPEGNFFRVFGPRPTQ